jgi:hypothetical protein
VSAWAYCDYCNGLFAKPTAQEVVDQIRVCRHCGRGNVVRHSTINELIVSMEERIQALEAAMQPAILTVKNS